MSESEANKTPYRFSPREILVFVGFVFLCIGTVLALTFYNIFIVVGAKGVSSFNPFIPDATKQAAAQAGVGYITPAPEIAPLPPPPEWDGSTRITMLVMGLDYRDWIANMGPSRTDTMVLLTIDPISKTAGMLSIPRDLWANIPGFKPQKINTAYRFGELYKYPGGGPGLAIKTVEGTIGVPIDYYAQIDFGAFINFIDLIGGVKLEIKEPIELEVIGKRVDVYIEPGVHVLGGDIALAYARARHTGGGDFERAERQQQVIMGIRDRLLNPKIFSILMNNAPQIYNELTQGIDTNLPLEDAIKLAFLAVQIGDEGVKRAILDESVFVYGRSPDDLSILIPLPDKIRSIRDDIFATGGAFTPLMTGDPLALMQLENAAIAIKNGTYNADIGNQTGDFLRSRGAQIVSSGPADSYYDQTTIIIHKGKPYTVAYLIELMNIKPTKILHQYDPHSTVDIEIIVGVGWINNNPMP
jgi:LCP family protein required for cell wall assembly